MKLFQLKLRNLQSKIGTLRQAIVQHLSLLVGHRSVIGCRGRVHLRVKGHIAKLSATVETTLWTGGHLDVVVRAGLSFDTGDQILYVSKAVQDGK